MFRKPKYSAPPIRQFEQSPDFPGHLIGNTVLHGMMAEQAPSAEDVAKQYGQLRQRVIPARETLKSLAPPDRLKHSRGSSFLHGDFGDFLTIDDAFVLNPERYRPPDQSSGPIVIPDDVPRGLRVSIQGLEDRWPLWQEIGSDVAFMPDGQILYHGLPEQQLGRYWDSIDNLPPQVTMGLAQVMMDGLEQHLNTP